MTTLIGQVTPHFNFGSLNDFVTIRDDGRFVLDLKAAKVFRRTTGKDIQL